jgi:hypothetical protein
MRWLRFERAQGSPPFARRPWRWWLKDAQSDGDQDAAGPMVLGQPPPKGLAEVLKEMPNPPIGKARLTGLVSQAIRAAMMAHPRAHQAGERAVPLWCWPLRLSSPQHGLGCSLFSVSCAQEIAHLLGLGVRHDACPTVRQEFGARHRVLLLERGRVFTDPMGVDSDRRSDRVRLQTSHSGDEHASYRRSTRNAERYL